MSAHNSDWQGETGRLFPELPPLVVTEKLRSKKESAAGVMIPALRRLGEAMRGPVAGRKGNNRDVPAGYTYLGQFIVHEIVHSVNGPSGRANLRSPFLDLDSVYGRGPDTHPFAYRKSRRIGVPPRKGRPASERSELNLGHMRESSNTGRISFPDRDLPRTGVPSFQSFPGGSTLDPGWAAVIDARNDQNLMVGQIHVAIARFHNALVSQHGMSLGAARREVIRHFQHIVLHDFLPKVAGEAAVTERLASRSLRLSPSGGPASVPIEFSLAAFRFGHSMVRDSYALNGLKINGSNVTPLRTLFDVTPPHGTIAPPVEAIWAVDWRRFFNLGKAPKDFNHSFPIGPAIAYMLAEQFNLPQVTLLGGYGAGLPCGQDVALALGIEPLSPKQVVGKGDFGGDQAKEAGFDKETPLWYYVLREADSVGNNGSHLGPVGARIAADVIISLLEDDPDSILNAGGWRPNLGDTPGAFTMADLLRVAGLDEEPKP